MTRQAAISRCGVGLLLAAACLGQPRPGAPRPEGSVASQAQIVAGLKAICPNGKIALSKSGDPAGCQQCPPGTSFPDDAWTLQSATLGYFTSDVVDDLVLSGHGCEPHVYSYGGSYLLRSSSGAWKLARYNQGIIANHCNKVRARDGRDLLLCTGRDAHQGEQEAFVYLLRFDATTEAKFEMIFEAVDTTGACPVVAVGARGEVQQASLDRVAYPDLNGDGRADLVIDVSFGKKEITTYNQDACYKAVSSDRPGAAQAFFNVPIRHYRLEFLFDGTKFAPTPPTRDALKVVGAELP
jgi:hypothetical protein